MFVSSELCTCTGNGQAGGRQAVQGSTQPRSGAAHALRLTAAAGRRCAGGCLRRGSGCKQQAASLLRRHSTVSCTNAGTNSPVMQALPQIPDDFRMAVEGDEQSQQQQQQQPDSKASGASSASKQQSGTGGQADSADTSDEGAGGQAEAAAGSGGNTKFAADTAGEDSAGDAGADALANATLPAAAAGTASSSSGNSSDSNVSSSSSVSDLKQPDKDGPDGHTDQTPRLNATEAATIDFDDVDADATHGSGFLARLSDSVTGAFGSVFS